MSLPDLPPYEPPPPYSEHPEPEAYYPPPVPVAGPFAYVPVPVMMPVYHPQLPLPPPEPVPWQHTYSTNYSYQQPSQSKEKINELIDWVPATESNCTDLAHQAFVAGWEPWTNNPFWVIRAHHSGDFIPGNLSITNRTASVPYGGKEIPVQNFEVLCAPPHAVCWVPSSNGHIPPEAIAAGNTHNGEPLYIGRGRHLYTVTPVPGKVHPSHGCCYVTYEGGEMSHTNYDVLCRNVI